MACKMVHLVAEGCAGIVEDAIGNKGAAGGFLNTAGVFVAGTVPVRPPNRPAASTHACPGAGKEQRGEMW